MIRRDAGDSYWLIAQHDHALLAGQFARRIGNDRFARPEPFEPVITGISLHDSGWPLHDDRPTLNDAGLPLDVFESPRDVASMVWTASVERAAAVDPYAGLLTSLHVLHLSVYAVTNPEIRARLTPQDVFASNKFQQCEIERQERLRRQLGMRTDRPLKYGLSETGDDPAERRLSANFHLLQAMDALSLAVCCTMPPFDQTAPVAHHPDGPATPLRLARINGDGGDDVTVDPWPFDEREVRVTVPARRVDRRAFDDVERFQAHLAGAPIVQLRTTVRPKQGS